MAAREPKVFNVPFYVPTEFAEVCAAQKTAGVSYAQIAKEFLLKVARGQVSFEEAARPAAARSQPLPVRGATRLTIEQVVTERMDANTFFARMAAAGYDEDQAEEASSERAAALKRGTIRDGRENGCYFIEPTGVKP